MKETDPAPLQLFCLQPIWCIYIQGEDKHLADYIQCQSNQPTGQSKHKSSEATVHFLSPYMTVFSFIFLLLSISIERRPAWKSLRMGLLLEVSGKKAFNIIEESLLYSLLSEHQIGHVFLN
jgi:hypothetical protein